MKGAIMGVSAAVWFPIITLILGATLKGVFDALSDQRASRREREARSDVRRDAIRERRIEFQRQTLLDLQDAVAKLARAAGLSHHEDVMAAAETGQWQKQKLSPEANDGFFQSQNDLARLRTRVRDDRVRELCAMFSDRCIRSTMAGDRAEGEQELMAMSSVLGELNDRVGIILRSLDDEAYDLA